MTSLRVLRGATFRKVVDQIVDGVPVDLTGYTITSQIRDPRDLASIVATATVTIADQIASPGEFEIDFGTSETWPIGALWLDIRIDSGGTVDYTERVILEVSETSTRP